MAVNFADPAFVITAAGAINVGDYFIGSNQAQSGNIRVNFTELTTYFQTNLTFVDPSANNIFTASQAWAEDDLTAGANVAVDASLGQLKRLTVDQNLQIDNPTNLPAAGLDVVFHVKIDGVGGHTVTFDTAYSIISGAIDNTANAFNQVRCIYDNTDGVLYCTIN